MVHKNDYSCIVFYKGGKTKKWQFVHGLSKFVTFINEKHPGWEYINVYERRTGKYLKRFYPGNIIPYFLTLLPFAIVLYFFLTFKTSASELTFVYGFNNTTTIRNVLGGKSGVLCQL